MRSFSKFKAHRINHLGRSFASKLEAAVYDLLVMRERAGEIEDLRCQDTVDLGYGIRWRIDFSATDKATGQRIYIEAKGVEVESYLLKLKLWRNGLGKGPLEIWKGSYTKPRLDEIVIPKGGTMEDNLLREEITALREKINEMQKLIEELRAKECHCHKDFDDAWIKQYTIDPKDTPVG